MVGCVCVRSLTHTSMYRRRCRPDDLGPLLNILNQLLQLSVHCYALWHLSDEFFFFFSNLSAAGFSDVLIRLGKWWWSLYLDVSLYKSVVLSKHLSLWRLSLPYTMCGFLLCIAYCCHVSPETNISMWRFWEIIRILVSTIFYFLKFNKLDCFILSYFTRRS